MSEGSRGFLDEKIQWVESYRGWLNRLVREDLFPPELYSSLTPDRSFVYDPHNYVYLDNKYNWCPYSSVSRNIFKLSVQH